LDDNGDQEQQQSLRHRSFRLYWLFPCEKAFTERLYSPCNSQELGSLSLSLSDCGVLYIQFLLLYLWIFSFPSSISAGDAAKVDLLKSLPNAANRLVLFQADIYNPIDFEPAIKGCDYVFHVATPLLHNTQSSQVCPFPKIL
jgi:hypothetical protein